LAERSWIWVAVFVVAFLLRIAAAVWWQDRLGEEQFGFPDSESYWQLGQTIADGKPYEFGEGGARMFRTPGYPALLSVIFEIGGNEVNVLWARLLNAVFGTLTVGGVAWITGQLFNRQTALVAAMLAAVYPGAIGMSVFVLAEGPFCLLMTLQVGCWIRWRTHQTSRPTTMAILIGITAGLAILVRPSWLLFLPAIIAINTVAIQPRPQSNQQQSNQQRGGRWGSHCVMLLALIVMLLPWWIRNYMISGALITTTTQVGASLYDGQGPQATGASDMRFVNGFKYAQQMADKSLPNPPEPAAQFEVRLDQRMRQAAVDQMAQSPSRVVLLAVEKFKRTWSLTPNDAMFQGGGPQLAIVLGYGPLIVLSLIGLFHFRNRRNVLLTCAFPAIYFTLIHMIFVGSLRYRQPPMLLLIIPAAAILVTAVQAFSLQLTVQDSKRRRRKK
jgi:4-amino-4-deoxy-L-arabinose transferase-like glycosyltransferase